MFKGGILLKKIIKWGLIGFGGLVVLGALFGEPDEEPSPGGDSYITENGGQQDAQDQSHEEQSETEGSAGLEPVEESSEPETTSEEAVEPQTMLDKLWQAADTSLKSRKDIDISYDTELRDAAIIHTDLEPFTHETFVRQAYTILVLWGQEAFKIDGVEFVTVVQKTKFIDQYGQESVQNGVVIAMSKTEFSKFDWQALAMGSPVDGSIAAAADAYFEHIAIKKEIKDRSKLYLSLQYHP